MKDRDLQQETVPDAGSPRVGPSVHTLPNGLRVVIKEDPSWPVVAVNMWVHAGGKDETDRVAGYSHYLEHLTSRGTTRRKPLQDRLDVFYVGGHNSANTYYDRTTYFNVVKSEYFDVALDAMADVMQHATLLAEGIEAERKVVTEELRRYYDNPDSAGYRELFRLAFAPHPYGRPVIGTFETLDGLRREDFFAYYKRMYVPDNMVLSICGDVRTHEVLEKVAAAFEGFQSGDPRREHPPLPDAFKGYQQATLRLDLRRSSVSLGFVVPGWRHPDRWALELLGRILGQGASSHLWQRIVEERRLALDAQAGLLILEDLGFFHASASPVDATAAWQVEAALLREILRIREDGVSADELDRIKRQARLHERFADEDVLNQAQGLGESMLYGGIRYHTEALDRLDAVTAAEVRDVARRYLVLENLTVVRTLPEATPEPPDADREAVARLCSGLATGQLRPVWLDFSRTTFAPAEANQGTGAAAVRSARSSGNAPSRRVLPNGLTVLFRPKPGKGIVAVALHARAGSRFDPPGQEGLSQLAACLPLLGTLEHSQVELAQRFDDWGGYYGFGVDREHLYGRVVLAREDAAAGAELFGEVVMHPRFDPADVANEKAKQQARIERQLDAIADVAWDRYNQAVFHGSPYAHRVLGTPEGVAACTALDAAEFWRLHVAPERAVLTIVGDLSQTEFEAVLERSGLVAWSSPSRTDREDLARAGRNGTEPELDSDPRIARLAPLAGRIAVPMAKQQVQVILGAPAVPILHPDYLAVRTLASLVGFRCFVDLVYNKALAYSTGGTASVQVHAGALALFIGSAAHNAQRVVDELAAKWREVQDELVGDEELGHIKDRIVGGQALSDQRAVALAASYGYYESIGLGYSFHDRQDDAIRALSARDLREVAIRYLGPDRLVTSIVGPAESLAALGQ